jgi:predicted alpha-1,6-mannanase (GH76 family)
MDRRAVTTLVVALASCVALATAGCGGGHGGGNAAATPRSSGPPSQPSATVAEVALGSFNTTFYKALGGGLGIYTRSTADRRRTVFWTSAELIEMVEDACQRTGAPVYKQMLVALMNGFVSAHGTDWAVRTWNDDIMWAIIASARAYQITGDTSYRDMAMLNFDQTYARAWSADLGGGLWWTTQRTEKNTTTNGPGAIAACLLYQTSHDPKYLREAEGLYAWERKYLFDPATGQVFDNIRSAAGSPGYTRAPWKFTYNQGTVIGAADLLFKITGKRGYYSDALRALTYTRSDLTVGGILQREGNGKGDTGGFKGIFARWAVGFTRDNHITAFDAWLRQNADTAWAHRNGSGLVGDDWAQQTSGAATLGSLDCSSAVVLLLALQGS